MSLYGYVGNNPVNFIDPSGLKPTEYYLNEWICNSESWDEAFIKARKEKMGPYDPEDAFDDDNRTAAEHYIFGRAMANGSSGPLMSDVYLLTGAYWSLGYQAAKLVNLFPDASSASKEQLYWEMKAYSDSIEFTDAFAGEPSGKNCSCTDN